MLYAWAVFTARFQGTNSVRKDRKKYLICFILILVRTSLQLHEDKKMNTYKELLIFKCYGCASIPKEDKSTHLTYSTLAANSQFFGPCCVFVIVVRVFVYRGDSLRCQP